MQYIWQIFRYYIHLPLDFISYIIVDQFDSTVGFLQINLLDVIVMCLIFDMIIVFLHIWRGAK